MLCWDCCQSQQKKGTLGPLEAARPLPEGAGGGDGASPFLFKPVDGDGVHGGKHVMRTRRNKEVRNGLFRLHVNRPVWDNRHPVELSVNAGQSAPSKYC